MPIESVSDSSMLVVRAAGALVREDILEVVTQYYPTLGGRPALWDLSSCDIGALSAEDFGTIVVRVKQIGAAATRRKTAYVVGDAASYVKMCKYLNEAVASRLPAEYAVFHTLAEAHEWLVETL
jgi:hypothetical protein